MKKYEVSAEVTSERGVGYIRLQKSEPGICKKTLIVCKTNGDEVGIHIDFDAYGRIFGIEVMDSGFLPPEASTQELVK